MERLIERKLVEWKESPRRKPLILMGIRQCGKTHIMKEFGRKHYANTVYFDFEQDPNLHSVFRDLDVRRIIKELQIKSGSSITKDTLIIFDEIQQCYPALTSLKYFLQDEPDYHLICAGSLLGLALAKRSKDDNEQKSSFPLGKVNILHMYPMCFGEFLLAREGRDLFNFIDDLSPTDTIPEWVMERLDGLYHEFLIVGGMPEAVKVWCDTSNIKDVRKVQDEIIEGYSKDIAKHCSYGYQTVMGVWDSAAYQVAEAGDRFNLKAAGGDSRKLNGPIQWLIDADLIRRAWEVNDASIPQNPRGGVFYKLYMPDCGLLSNMARINADILMSNDGPTSDIRGAMAENFVLNELTYALDRVGDAFYWMNPKGKGEVDFQIQFGRDVVPIKVKSGVLGRMQSLEYYCRKYTPKTAFVISGHNVRLGNEDTYTFVPLYMMWKFGMYAEAVGLKDL